MKRISFAALLAGCFLFAASPGAQVHAVEPVSGGDLFDVNLGAIVTDSSPGTITPAANMFGGTGGVEPLHLIFGDGQLAGAILFVEWQLPWPVPLAGFNAGDAVV